MIPRGWPLLLGATLLLGCNLRDWRGTYVGQLSETGSCTDGSKVDWPSTPARWDITQTGAELVVAPWQGACGTYAGRSWGSIATLETKACGSQTSNGFIIDTTLAGGDLAIENTESLVAPNRIEGTLHVEWSVFELPENGGRLLGKCSSDVKTALDHQ